MLLEQAVEQAELGEPALKILTGLGPKVFPFLVEAVRACPSPAEGRRRLALLRPLGAPIRDPLLADLGTTREPAVVLARLELCQDWVEEPLFWAQVPALLAHEGVEVRKKVLELCRAKRRPELYSAWAERMRAESAEAVLGRWVESLTELRDPAGVEALGELLARTGERELSEELRLRTVRALAITAAPSITPHLGRLVRPAEKGLTAMWTRSREPGKGAPKALRLAAIEALGPLYQQADVLALLQPLRHDPDAEIARTVVAVLNGLVTSVRPAPAATLPAASAESPRASRSTLRLLPLPMPPGRSGSHRVSARQQDPFNPFGSASARGVSGPAAPQPPAGEEAARAAAPAAPEPAAPMSGMLKDHGLEAVLRGCGRRLGAYRFTTSAGEARIYLSNGVILEAQYPGRFGLEALRAIHVLDDAPFDFLPEAESRGASLALRPEQIGPALTGALPAGAQEDKKGDAWGGSDY